MNAIYTDETGGLVYNWSAIALAAKTAKLDPNDVKDYAFEMICDACTAQQVVDAYVAFNEEI